MRKTKKAVALLLGMSMIATCFSACGSSDDASSEDKNRVVEFDENAVNEGSEKTGIAKPDKQENNADAEQVTLKVWCPSEEQEITKALCETFDDAHPEYAITFDYGVVSEADAKTQIELDPQNAADVFMFAGDHLKSLQEGGYLAKFNDTVATTIKDEQIDQAYASCEIDGGLYAVPFTANLWYMFYNKSMYTADEVTSLDTMLAKNFDDVNGNHVYNFSIDVNNGWYLAAFFYAGGCTLYGEDGTDATKCDWAEDKGIAVVDYLSSLVQTQKFYDDDSTDSIAKLGDGTVGAFCTGSWNAGPIKEALGENYAATCAPQITVNGTTEWLKPFADFKMIGVNSSAQNMAAAQYLAEFLGGEYGQLTRLQLREVQPTVKKLIEDQDIVSTLNYEEDYPAVAASLAQMSHTVNRPTTTQIANYWTPAQGLGGYIYKQKEEVTGADRQSYIKEKIVSKMIVAE